MIVPGAVSRTGWDGDIDGPFLSSMVTLSLMHFMRNLLGALVSALLCAREAEKRQASLPDELHDGGDVSDQVKVVRGLRGIVKHSLRVAQSGVE
jgi:hypothetical protein